jgi:acetyl esterase/lipase
VLDAPGLGTRYPQYREFPDWSSRPTVAHFGPASWQSELLAILSAIFVKPVIGLLVNGTLPPPTMPPEADLRGLGPFLLQVGTEMLRNATYALADRLRADDVPVWVQLWHKAIHMFQLSFDVNPDARNAVADIADFIGCVTGERPGEAAA